MKHCRDSCVTNFQVLDVISVSGIEPHSYKRLNEYAPAIFIFQYNHAYIFIAFIHNVTEFNYITCSHNSLLYAVA